MNDGVGDLHRRRLQPDRPPDRAPYSTSAPTRWTHALKLAEEAKKGPPPLSIGVLGNAAVIVPELLG
jgi:urocanate hydratase